MAAPDGPPHDLVRLVTTLDRHGIDYVLVGGAAARAYGVRRLTEDADCVVRRGRDNLERLADALRELHARLRVGGMTDEEASRLPVQIDAATLETAGMSTWMTDAGGFDVLAGLESGDGFAVRAAALDDIIAAKERADRAKDHETLPELRALRDAGLTPESPDEE